MLILLSFRASLKRRGGSFRAAEEAVAYHEGHGENAGFFTPMKCQARVEAGIL